MGVAASAVSRPGMVTNIPECFDYEVAKTGMGTVRIIIVSAGAATSRTQEKGPRVLVPTPTYLAGDGAFTVPLAHTDAEGTVS